MTIKELIEILSKFDWEKEVRIWDKEISYVEKSSEKKYLEIK